LRKRWPAEDRARRDAFAQQPRGMVLVVDPNVEQDIREPVEYGGKPGGHGVGVDRDGDPCGLYGFVATHFGKRVGLKQSRLRRQAQEGNPCGRCPTGLFTDHQHLADQ
jgi:hypothetical protein